MPGRIVRRGSHALKTLDSQSLDHGRHVVRWSRTLNAVGVPTPVASLDEHRGCLSSTWIEGRSGRDVLCDVLAEKPAGETALARFLDTAVRPLVRLHSLSPEIVDVPLFDPWRRVRPRLAAGSSSSEPLRARAREIAQGLAARHEALSGPGVSVVVHGDFHAGQLLFEWGRPEPWLLDLDDLGIGIPEADLGNFLAHLATCGLLPTSSPAVCVDSHEAILASAYSAHGGREPDIDRLRIHTAIALIRRALKMAERGDPAAASGDALTAAAAVSTRLVSRSAG